MISSRLRPPPGRLLAIACLCAAVLFGMANQAQATPLAPGQPLGATPDAIAAGPATLTVLADQTAMYTLTNVGGTVVGMGTVREMVVKGDTLTNSTPGGLDFMFQITSTMGTISQATLTSYASFTTDVAAVSALTQNPNLPGAHQFATDTAGGVVVGNVTRQGNGVGVSYGFNDANFGAGTISQIMLIRTNALSWDGLGTVALVDGGSGNTVAFEPTPEPASLTMLGIGLVGMAGYGCYRRRKAATL